MHSIAIFLGFLVGSFGLVCFCGVAWAFWVSRSDACDDPVLSPGWVRPVFALTLFPMPLLLTVGGGAALWWGFAG
jgi:hypothetical protein